MPLDPRLVIAGFRGTLHFENGELFAECGVWRVQANFRNSDHQPAGGMDEHAILQGVSYTLSLTETVIQDVLPGQLLDALDAGQQPVFHFMGEVQRGDGTVGQYPIRSAVPDGTIDVMSVQVGQEITREWNFRLNERPRIQAG